MHLLHGWMRYALHTIATLTFANVSANLVNFLTRDKTDKSDLVPARKQPQLAQFFPLKSRSCFWIPNAAEAGFPPPLRNTAGIKVSKFPERAAAAIEISFSPSILQVELELTMGT